jgi:Fe-S-cluster-containing hydrogenase component 2
MMEAIREDNGAYQVDAERCIGCGVCTITCPTDSIALKRRSTWEEAAPPEDMKAWMEARTAAREV